jgi:hypothetical protein
MTSSLHEGFSLIHVALAVQARYVSVSFLAEGKEATLLRCGVPSRRGWDAHRRARRRQMNRFRGRVV